MRFGLNMGLQGVRSGGAGTPPSTPLQPGDYVWYNMDPATGYEVDTAGNNRIIDQDTVAPDFDGMYYGTVLLALNATQRLELPVITSLSASDTTSTDTATWGDELGTYLKINDTDFNLAVTTPGTTDNRPYLNCGGLVVSGEMRRVSFTASNITGTAVIAAISVAGLLGVNHTVHDGLNQFDLPAGSSEGQGTWLYWDGTQAFSVEITGFASQVVQPVENYITWQNADGDVISSATSEVVSFKSITFKFSNYFVTDVVLTEADRIFIKANPASVVSMQLTGIPDAGLSFGPAAIHYCVPGTNKLNSLYMDEIVETVHYYFLNFDNDIYHNCTYASKGLPSGQFLLTTAGAPNAVIDSRLLRFATYNQPSYIDVGAAIDGTLDFSILISFSMATYEASRYMIGTDIGISNQLSLAHPPEGLELILGQTTILTTIADTDMQAVWLKYSQATSSVEIATNGGSLGAAEAVVIDGPTGAIWLGCSNSGGTTRGEYEGYLGEVVITGDEMTSTVWEDYWARVSVVVAP